MFPVQVNVKQNEESPENMDVFMEFRKYNSDITTYRLHWERFMRGCLFSLLSSVAGRSSSGNAGMDEQREKPPLEPSLVLPCEFAGYRVEELVGHGGFSFVYRAVRLSDGETVALKLPRTSKRDDVDFEKYWFREAGALRAISHPNIVKLIDLNSHDGQIYLVMEFVNGPTLSQWLLDNKTTITNRQMVEIMYRLTQGLGAVHQARHLHLDLKPSNILMDGENPRITDFGFARRTHAEGHASLSAPGGGTAAYMSPEQIRGDIKIGVASDIYSLGVVYYQILSGRLPHKGNNVVEIVQSFASSPKWPRKSFLPGMLDVVALTMRCIERESEKRFQSCGEIGEKLDSWLKSGRIKNDHEMQRWWRKHLWKISFPFLKRVAIAVLMLMTLSFFTVTMVQRLHESDIREFEAKSAELFDVMAQGKPSQVRLGIQQMEEKKSPVFERLYGPVDPFIINHFRHISDNHSEVIATLPKNDDKAQHYYGIKFVPNSSTFLVTTSTGKLQWWDVEHPEKMLKQVDASSTELNDVQISNNGLYAATSDDDGEAKIWEIATGKCLATFDKPTIDGTDFRMMTEIVFSPHDDILYMNRKIGEIIAWNWRENSQDWVFKTKVTPGILDDSESFSIDITDEGDLLAVGCEDNRVLLIETKTGTIKNEIVTDQNEAVTQVRIHGPKRQVLFNISTKQLAIANLDDTLIVHTLECPFIAVNLSEINEKDNTFLLKFNETVERRHWPSLAVERAWVGAEANIWDMAFCDKSPWMVTSSRDSTLRRVRLENSASETFTFPHSFTDSSTFSACIVRPKDSKNGGLVALWGHESHVLQTLDEFGNGLTIDCGQNITTCQPVNLWTNLAQEPKMVVCLENGEVHLFQLPRMNTSDKRKYNLSDISEFQFKTGTIPLIHANRQYTNFAIVSRDEDTIDLLDAGNVRHTSISYSQDVASGLASAYWSFDSTELGHSNGDVVHIWRNDGASGWNLKFKKAEDSYLGIVPLNTSENKSVIVDFVNGWHTVETGENNSIHQLKQLKYRTKKLLAHRWRSSADSFVFLDDDRKIQFWDTPNQTLLATWNKSGQEERVDLATDPVSGEIQVLQLVRQSPGRLIKVDKPWVYVQIRRIQAD